MNLYNLLLMFMACLCSPFYILGLSSMFWCFFTDFSNCQSTTSWSGLSLDSKRRGDRPLVACCNYSSIMFDYSTGKIIYRWLDRQQYLCNSNRQLWCPNGTNFDQSSASRRLPWEFFILGIGITVVVVVVVVCWRQTLVESLHRFGFCWFFPLKKCFQRPTVWLWPLLFSWLPSFDQIREISAERIIIRSEAFCENLAHRKNSTVAFR